MKHKENVIKHADYKLLVYNNIRNVGYGILLSGQPEIKFNICVLRSYLRITRKEIILKKYFSLGELKVGCQKYINFYKPRETYF